MRELGARANAELAVDAGERCLDRALRKEEGRRNLTVGLPFGDEGCDSPLGLGELVARRHAAADAGELGAGLVGPELCAEALELGQCALEGRTGGAAFLRTPLRAPLGEQGPCSRERVDVTGMLGDGALEAREGGVDVAARRDEQRATAGEDGERPGAVERSRAGLPGREDGVRLVELTAGDKRLEKVAELDAHPRLVHERVA